MKKIDFKEIIKKMNPKNAFRKFNIKDAVKKINLKDAKTKKRALFIALIAIVLIIILVRTTGNIQRVLFKGHPAAAKKGAAITFEEEAAPVKVYKIKKMDFKDTLPAIGNIKGLKEVDLKFQVAGIIESFNFEEGEKIQEGDIIASLIQRDALLKLKYSELELNKNQKLFEIGAISQMKIDQAKLEYESAKSELDKTNIYAMSNGLLGSRLLDVGNYVTPNDKVGSFVSIDKVYGEFNIIEKDVPKVALGQKADIFIDSFPNKSFSGTVDRIAPIIEGRSRTENVKVEIDNKEGLLKPGMFTRALIYTYEKKEALVVPASALKKKEADYFVYVVQKEEKKEPVAEEKKKKSKWLFGIFDKKTKKAPKKEEEKPGAEEKKAEFGTVEIRKMKLGYMTQDLVEVAEGLKEDELIIVEVQEEFKDKSKVEIAEVQEGIF